MAPMQRLEKILANAKVGRSVAISNSDRLGVARRLIPT